MQSTAILDISKELLFVGTLHRKPKFRTSLQTKFFSSKGGIYSGFKLGIRPRYPSVSKCKAISKDYGNKAKQSDDKDLSGNSGKNYGNFPVNGEIIKFAGSFLVSAIFTALFIDAANAASVVEKRETKVSAPSRLATEKAKKSVGEGKKVKRTSRTMTFEEHEKWVKGMPIIREKIPFTDLIDLKAEGKLKAIVKHPAAKFTAQPTLCLVVRDDDVVLRTVIPSRNRNKRFWDAWDSQGFSELVMDAYTPTVLPLAPEPWAYDGPSIRHLVDFIYKLANWLQVVFSKVTLPSLPKVNVKLPTLPSIKFKGKANVEAPKVERKLTKREREQLKFEEKKRELQLQKRLIEAERREKEKALREEEKLRRKKEVERRKEREQRLKLQAEKISQLERGEFPERVKTELEEDMEFQREKDKARQAVSKGY